MQVVDGTVNLAVFAVDEVIDHSGLQWTGAEQRHERHDVLEAIRLQAPHEIFHAARFQLEHRGGPAGFQQREALRVGHRDRTDIQRRLAALRSDAIDDHQTLVDDRERAQAQEVELHQTRGFDVVLVELRNDVSALIVAVQRRVVSQHRRRDDDTTRVHARVTGDAFERAREVDEVFDLLFGVI